MHAHGKKIALLSVHFLFYIWYCYEFSNDYFFMNLVVMHIHIIENQYVMHMPWANMGIHSNLMLWFFNRCKLLFYLDSRPLVFENGCIDCNHMIWRGLLIFEVPRIFFLIITVNAWVYILFMWIFWIHDLFRFSIEKFESLEFGYLFYEIFW